MSRNVPPLEVIRPPEDLTEKIAADELELFRSLWPAHLTQSLTHYLCHARPKTEAEALRILETFYGRHPPIFRRAAARLYSLNLNQPN